MTEGYMKNEFKTAHSGDTSDATAHFIARLGDRTAFDPLRKLQSDTGLLKNGVCYEALYVYGCPFPFLNRSI
jgi:hypothetical protein